MASAKPPMPTPPSRPHCTNALPTAPPLEGTVDDVGLVVDEVDEVAEGEAVVDAAVVLDVELEISLASMNTPPAMAGGEAVLAVLAALW